MEQSHHDQLQSPLVGPVPLYWPGTELGQDLGGRAGMSLGCRGLSRQVLGKFGVGVLGGDRARSRRSLRVTDKSKRTSRKREPNPQHTPASHSNLKS